MARRKMTLSVGDFFCSQFFQFCKKIFTFPAIDIHYYDNRIYSRCSRISSQKTGKSVQKRLFYRIIAIIQIFGQTANTLIKDESAKCA